MYNKLMKEYYSMSLKEKDKVIEKIKEVLAEKEEVVFAVVYGSFYPPRLFGTLISGFI
jgi:hypothetical protein